SIRASGGPTRKKLSYASLNRKYVAFCPEGMTILNRKVREEIPRRTLKKEAKVSRKNQEQVAMSSAQKSGSQWGHSYRLTASEKWKAKSAAMGRDATHALVDYARPQAGMQVLDLASGTGEPAITLASRIGPEGHVVALDLSPELLQIAEERGRERHLTNLTTRQADANNLPFPDQSFDLITSRFGVMFLDEDALS